MFEQKIAARDIMTSPAYTVQPTDRVKRVIALLCTHRIGGMPVVDPKDESWGLPRETRDEKNISERRPARRLAVSKEGGPVRSVVRA